MTQRGAPRGMLINGHSILVYDQLEGGLQTPAIEVSLTDVVLAWRGEHVLAQGKSGMLALDICGHANVLAALWRRFNRSSFATLQGLIDDLTLQSGSNAAHRTEGDTWIPSKCRIQIVRIDDDNADLLTEAVKGLIAEFEDDADAQLVAIEADFQEYENASRCIPSENVPLQAQEDSLVADALTLMSRVDKETKEYDASLLRKIMRSEILAAELTGIERRLYEIHQIKAGKGSEKDPIYNLVSRIRAFTDKRYRYLTKLQARHQDSIRVVNYINTWKEKTASLVFQSSETGKLRREFLAQTAYLIIIRILLVRIMEDKKLVNRMFTNGGIALWFREVESHYLKHAMGRSANFLLDLAYTSAQHIYAHFFAERTVLDWYTPDRNAVIRVLHKLAGFDLRHINRDIIGTVYNQYVEAKHKHESGMYFTPPDVVSFMLDRIGYKGTSIIGTKIIDLSCGSGGFLVEAAKRLVDAYKDYWKDQGYTHIPANQIQVVLDEIRESLHGIDLNPFACSLAETNLLIQVIDLFTIAFDAGEQAVIERFHIYNSDSLSFSADTLASQAGTLPFPEDELPIEDQVKAGLGKWNQKYDFVVGNPPYVKANENEFLGAYRESIKREYPSEIVRSVMVQKWDLFVPFVAASMNLLREGNEHVKAGKMAIITSNAIETVPYCDVLRQAMVDKATIEQIHFFPGIKLFADAMVQNTIVVLTRQSPSGHTHTTRYWHSTAPKWGVLGQAKTQALRQSQYLTDVFRQELPSIQLKTNSSSIPLEDIFYISVGMVLNANEKTNKGAFTINDLIVDKRDSEHTAPFAGSKDVDYFGIKNIKYLEYGENTRVPAQVRRPTFPELYEHSKLMVAEFGGFAYDDGTWDSAGFLKCNHSVFILMPWHNLSEVDNSQIRSQLDARLHLRQKLEASSKNLDMWYVLAFLNSRQMRVLLDGVNRSAIQGRLQPDDLRQISIPIPDAMTMSSIANLAQQASDLQKQLLPLRQAGWKFDDSTVTSPAYVHANTPKLALDRAKVKWGLSISAPTAKVSSLVRVDHRLFFGKKEVASISSSEPVEALEWIRRQFESLPDGTTFEVAERAGIEIPATPQAAALALKELVNNETHAAQKLASILSLKEDISKAIDVMFEAIPHPPIK